MIVGVIGGRHVAALRESAWRGAGADTRTLLVDEGALCADGGSERLGRQLDELAAVCDVLDICSPTPRRVAVLAAAAAGRSVICEQPFAHTVLDAEKMVNACSGSGGVLYPSGVVRHEPAFRVLRDGVAEGAVGRPAIVHVRRAGSRPADEARDCSDTARSIFGERMAQDYVAAIGIAGPVSRVHARFRRGAGTDVGIAILTHASGAVSRVEHVASDHRRLPRASFEVYGSDGYLTSPAQPSLGLLGPDGAWQYEHDPEEQWVAPVRAEIADFLHGLEHRGSSLPVPEEGIVTAAVAEAAISSARAGNAMDLL